MKKLIDQLNDIVKDSFEKCGYDAKYGTVTVSNRPDLCQFQCNGALPAAKAYKKPPFQIAAQVLEELKKTDIFKDVTSAGPGFINMTITDEFLSEFVNNMMVSDKFGFEEPEKPKTVVIDYGGANVAKPLHVGHLRAAIIGESIKRIERFMGNRAIGDVHLGDWGLQIGMVISEVRRRQPELPYFDESFTGEYPDEAPFTVDELSDIYPAASKLAKSDEAAMEEARKATAELQEGRRGYIALWKQIMKVSVADLKKNYGDLNVHFDLWNGESDSQKYIDPMVESLKEKGFPYESEGALVIDVSKPDDTHTIPPFMLLKSDGASLYSTTDLATIVERVEDYDPDEIIYVVDKRQSLHFEQVFRCAKKTGIAKDGMDLSFVGFGTMNGKDGKPFKTREGGVMRLRDLIDIIQNHVKTKLKDNASIQEDEIEDISRKVGTAALKYGDLTNQVTKDYVFDIDRFSSFEGNTGPYILYTVVRIKSILRKAADSVKDLDMKILKPYGDTERDLMLKLTKFNDAIEVALSEKAPNKICEYVYDLSNLFNRFYHDNKIISEENIEKKMSWLSLISLTKSVIETSLDLLGIEAPDKM